MTGIVVRWPKHMLYRCLPGKAQCIEGRCMYCEGGLSYCTTCKGGEGSLPTDCPGEAMSREVEQAVMAGRLNYIRDLGWVDKGDCRFKAN